MNKRSVYLDYAAATPMDASVLKSMQPYFSDQFFNPSANYLASRNIKQVIQNCRKTVAEILGAKPSEIIFTAGGTEANNLAISGVMSAYPMSKLVISALEHPSIYQPSSKYPHSICPVDSSGLVDINKLRELIDDKTVLISIIYVNNEIGTVQPLKEISLLVSSIRKDRQNTGVNLPLYFHTDACQAANYLDLHASSLGVDMITLNGGKIYGPKQSGALMVRSSVNIKPIILGGGQERNLRSGTENVTGIVGFSEALKLASKNRKQNSLKTAKLQHYFISEITNNFDRAMINGSLTKRVANNIHVTFKDVDNEWLLIKLDDLGIMAAAGSACSASNDKPSTVLSAIGLSDKDARNSIRFSIGNNTSKADIDYTLLTLKQLVI